jgi:hypothetical protein
MNRILALDSLGRVTEIAEKRKAFTAKDAKDAKENQRLDLGAKALPARTDRHAFHPAVVTCLPPVFLGVPCGKCFLCLVLAFDRTEI